MVCVCGAWPSRRQKLPSAVTTALVLCDQRCKQWKAQYTKSYRACRALASMPWWLGTVVQKRVGHKNGAWLTLYSCATHSPQLNPAEDSFNTALSGLKLWYHSHRVWYCMGQTGISCYTAKGGDPNRPERKGCHCMDRELAVKSLLTWSKGKAVLLLTTTQELRLMTVWV